MPKKQSKTMSNEIKAFFFFDLKVSKVEAILFQIHARRGVRVE